LLENGTKDACHTQQQQQQHFTIMFVSTTGDGEHCDSCIQSTWNALLKRNLSSDLLRGSNFALFALGDRAYGPDAFCAAGRKLGARLIQLGAGMGCSMGYGDDNTSNGGVFADLDDWISGELVPKVVTKMKNLEGGGLHAFLESWQTTLSSAHHVCVPRPAYEVIYESNSNNESSSANEVAADNYDDMDYFLPFYQSMAPKNAYRYSGLNCVRNDSFVERDDNKNPLYGNVVDNVRMTDAKWIQDVRQITISVRLPSNVNGARSTNGRHVNDNVSNKRTNDKPYDAGDVAVIMPQNDDQSVNRFIQYLPQELSCRADESIKINRVQKDYPRWPERCTLRTFLKRSADINGRPDREFLRALSSLIDRNHSDGAAQASKLFELSEPSGATLYADYILREKRNYADVLFDFDALRSGEGRENRLTFEILLSMLPPVYPRHFSIASSPSDRYRENIFSIELCVGVVNQKTPFGRKVEGLCSNFLANFKKENTSRLIMWIKPGSFLDVSFELCPLTSSFRVPCLYVGAGTGVAPLRSIFREREHRRCTVEKNKIDLVKKPDQILFLGHRKIEADYLYGSEWLSFQSSSEVSVTPVFSQEQQYKTYVQNILSLPENTLFISNHVLKQGGAIYIAGGARMARAVVDVILEVLSNNISGGEKAAKKLLKSLNRQGKFRVEAWN